MLMEVKKDYKNAIVHQVVCVCVCMCVSYMCGYVSVGCGSVYVCVMCVLCVWVWGCLKASQRTSLFSQTLKSAIGMKESEETAGLASPKLRR